MPLDPVDALNAVGLRGPQFRLLAMGSVGLCLTLWIRARTVTQSARANAERRAIFVGLWPPTLLLLGAAVDRRRAEGAGPLRRRWR